MRKIYQKIRAAEMYIAISFLCLSVTAIFVSAVLRTVKMPIRWGLDIALLLFTWSTFLGADLAFQRKCLVRVDMLINILPAKVRRVFEIAVYIIMLSAIVFLLVFGLKLTVISRARVFQGLPSLSYSWVTASVPVSMLLMLITALIQVYQTLFPGRGAGTKD